MSNERRNDNRYWKDKLEELDSLPEETSSDKSAAWEKLHQRLRGNARKRKIAWYWIAAACLVFVILVPFNLKKKESVSIDVSSEQHPEKVRITQPAPDSLRKADSTITLYSGKTKLREDVHQKRNSKTSLFENVEKKVPELSISVTPLTIEPEVANITVSPTDTVVVNNTAVVLKKKLRVVHINELGELIEEISIDKKFADRLSFYKKFTNQEVFPDIHGNSQSFNNDLLKIKITPQN